VLRKTVNAAVKRNREERLKFNVVTDLTTVAHIGDLIEVDRSELNRRSWKVIELKEGKVNELLSNLIEERAGHLSSDELAAIGETLGPHSEKQARRMLKQQERQTEFENIIRNYYGLGVPQDYTEAAKWLRKAAEQGDASTQSRLGSLYYYGLGVPQDYEEALRWYRKAAEQGDAAAQFMLGTTYYYGQGVPQDHAEAVKWYRKAAEQGHASAQYWLGVAFSKGQGVPQDYAQAVKWIQLAAEQGNAPAQFRLGLTHMLGQGVPQDYIQAHKWLNLATSRASAEETKEYGSHRDGIGTEMTTAQIAEAQRFAREWKPKTWDELKGQVTQ